MVRRIAPLAIVCAAILWSLDGLLRQSLYAAPSLLVVTLEHALGTLLFLPFLFIHRREIPTLNTRTWAALGWVSLFGGILGTALYTKALGQVGYIELSVVVLLQKLQPFFAISLAAIVLRERLTLRFLILALCAFAGGYLLTFPDLTVQISKENTHLYAALLATGAAACWGTSTVLGKQALQQAHFSLATGLRLLLTSLIAIIPVLYLHQAPAALSFTSTQWLSLLLIVCSTGSVALGIYYFGLKRVPASHATMYELAWPLSAVVLDRIVHHTVLAPTQYLGAVVLLTSLLLLPRQQTKNE